MRILLGLLIFIGGINAAWCYTGFCTPYPSTHEFHYNFGSIAIKDIENNKAGTILPEQYKWSSGGDYKGSCDCNPNGPASQSYFTTRTSLANGHTFGYFKVNDYLEVSTAVFLVQSPDASSGNFVQTPWKDEPNEYYESCDHAQGIHTFATGSQGKMSFYIAKAFVGVTVIVDTKVLDIYASRSKGSYGSMPLASISVAGQITAPQNCVINAGQMVTVDFGSIYSGEFTNKGGVPTGVNPKSVNTSIKCNNIDAYANLTLRFQSTASTSFPSAIKTDNNDVGVIIMNNAGNIIKPNTGLIPFTLGSNAEATVTFKAAPVSTTGNIPSAGQFKAQAYIRVDFA